MVTVLACAPVNINEVAGKLGLPHYSPGIDYSLIPCDADGCRIDMWIGPLQAAAYAEHPDRFVRLCFTCARKAAPFGRAVRLQQGEDSPRRHG